MCTRDWRDRGYDALVATKGPPTKIYVWCYPEEARHFPGWHLTADRPGCAELANAVTALTERDTHAAARSLATLPVTASVLAVPNNRRAQARSAKKIRFALAADDPRGFALHEQNGIVTVEIGRQRIDELLANIAGIPRGRGDFAMRPDGNRIPAEQALWFWWMLSQEGPRSDRSR